MVFFAKKDYYKSYRLVKAANVKVEYTQQQTEEYIKCANDPIYFIENYVKIVSLDGGETLFKLYPFQKKLIKSFIDNRYTIAKVGRQLGKTESVIGFILWFILFNENKTCAILANLEKTAKGILTRLRKSYEKLPWWLQQGVTEWNQLTIALENGSKIMTSATTESGIRSAAIDLLFVDEMSFIDNNIAEAFWASSWPTISSGKNSKAIVVSTPKGYNFFHKLYTEAEQGLNGFVPISTHWSEVPGRTKIWADEQLKVLGPVKFAQEVLAEFLGSSFTLIDAQYLGLMAPDKPLAQDEHIKIYEKPSPNRIYAISADPAEGKEQDYSAFIVFDITTFPITIAAIYRCNTISPNIWPNIILNFAKSYNNAWLLVETNGSHQVADIIADDFGYEHMLSQDFHAKDVGIKMTKKTKKQGCANLKDIIESGKMRINDMDFISELHNFIVRKNGTFGADQGKHDDLTMCAVILAWFSGTPQYAELSNDNLRNSLREKNEKFLEDSLLPFGFYVPVIPDNETMTLNDDQIGLLGSISDDNLRMIEEMRMKPPTEDELEFLKSLAKY